MSLVKDSPIVVVGAGCFGISTAYHLLKRGFTNVTVLDRSETLPSPDAAGTDMNKIVRSAYLDSDYTRLVREAIDDWKREEWQGTYHECGVLSMGQESVYWHEAYRNDLAVNARIQLYPPTNDSEQKDIFPASVPVHENLKGYLNFDGGWASSGRAVEIMSARVLELGGHVVGGKAVRELLTVADGESTRTTGVICADGSRYDAHTVVIATGSWTSSFFPSLGLPEGVLTATGQCVATIKLDADEAERYHKCPVVLDFSTGFYIFPPKKDGVVKMAIHGGGYTRYVTPADTNTMDGTQNTTSTPRTVLSHGADGLRIPKEQVKDLRKGLASVYPALAKKSFASTRLCWYMDTPDEDFIIGKLNSGLVVASGGSGHAFKFLPTIGRLVADSIQDKLDPALAAKFSPRRPFIKHSESSRSRAHQRKELNEVDLCTPEDLEAE